MPELGMTRRAWLSVAAGAVAGCATTQGLSRGYARPNIVLIMADDLGYGDLSCYGGAHVETPHIDAMAANGVRLTDYHSNGTVCSPTRAALMTGNYQQRCGVQGVIYADDERHLGMPLESYTLAEHMQSAGYATGIAGKWHLGYEARFGPLRQGFDSFHGFVSGNIDYHSHYDRMGYEDWWDGEEIVPEEGYLTDLITDHAVRFIESHGDVPFFLYVPHGAPHAPFQGRGDDAIRTEGKVHKENGDSARLPEMIAALDDSVGRITQALRDAGQLNNTVLVFCSDNGPTPHGSAGPLRGSKGSVFEGGHRVPCVVQWPGRIAANSVCNESILSMDLFPTFAAMVNAPVSNEHVVDGIDVSKTLLDGAALPNRPLYWKYENRIAMRDGSWKMVIERDNEGLFNLRDDLGEQRNLRQAESTRFERMAQRARKWYKEIEQDVAFVT